ncbi:hypothetical protein RJ639_037472 [Escallonia herrerae]|uniref:Reverse transcriptase/retrotransposon-derived protein RNase H-like domain-containing protein n=1 Tax=Escallonia herrerae TaxID=1293975 RepID=A0AA88WWB2_9ASTE|nr:hypothetical protein RJ639_037472 [Escallonia herrerae]
MEGREDREENTSMINAISGGLAARGSSGQARKAYAREVCITSQPPDKKQKTMPVAMITFFDEDSKDIKTPHDDPLVITIKDGNFDVKRVLVDNWSSIEVVVATYHLKMKFSTEHGIGEVKGDQTTAHQCYMASCRSKNKEALIIEDLREDTKMQRRKPVEELVSIEVYPRKKNKTVRISLNLKEDTKLELKLFEELKTYLSSPPLLSKPLPGENLFLYLSVTEVAVSTVLVKEEEGVQKPIYYVSKVLQDVETRYPKINKIALALIKIS